MAFRYSDLLVDVLASNGCPAPSQCPAPSKPQCPSPSVTNPTGVRVAANGLDLLRNFDDPCVGCTWCCPDPSRTVPCPAPSGMFAPKVDATLPLALLKEQLRQQVHA